MKRIVAYIIALALFVAAFAGCSAPVDEPAPTVEPSNEPTETVEPSAKPLLKKHRRVRTPPLTKIGCIKRAR